MAAAALFLSAFVSATLLPGHSELALLAYLRLAPEDALIGFWAATLGNTLGGLSSYAVGRLLLAAPKAHALGVAARFGPPALLLSWLPVVGDALPLAAGWLRWPAIPCALFLALGKAGRYALLLWAAG